MEIGGEALGSYSNVKVLCIPSSAKCSLITNVLLAPGDRLRVLSSETKVSGLQFYALCSLLKWTFHVFPIRNLIRCKRPSGGRILSRKLVLILVCLLFRPQSISSLCVPMSSDLPLNGRVQTLWEKEDPKVM